MMDYAHGVSSKRSTKHSVKCDDSRFVRQNDRLTDDGQYTKDKFYYINPGVHPGVLLVTLLFEAFSRVFIESKRHNVIS